MNPNLEILMLAAVRLKPLLDDLVFLGGCATGLLISDVAAPPIRATRDVDVITEVSSRSQYYQLSDRLREAGFREDQSDGAPLCRWVAEGVLLDVMPTDPKILGFTNRWYLPALKAAQEIILPSGLSIQMVTGPYFLATKLEAFLGRGQSDYLSSHDMEDIVAVLDGRSELADEVRQADPRLKEYLVRMFSAFLEDRSFLEALAGHLPPDSASQDRRATLIDRIRVITG